MSLYRALRDLALAPRLSVATESTGTVLTPSQMSEIAGNVLSSHDVSAAQTQKFGRTGLSTCARKPCVGRRHDLD